MNLLHIFSACLCISGILASPILVEEMEVDANDTTAVTVPVTEVTVDILTTMPSIGTFSTASSGPIITIEPQTSGKTTPTNPSSVTPASMSTPVPMSTTQAPPPPPEKETGFDGASFGGGIGAGIGICIVLFIVWKIYVKKTQAKGYSTM